jgi:predicted nucleotidyltransferase
MLVSLILYGSRARGDHRLRSDVDLLGVVEGGAIHKEIVARGASFYHYPAPTLLEKSKSGDLFLLHLVKEGKVLHDTLGFFEEVRDSFEFSDSYDDIIRAADAIARFIENRPTLLQSKKVRKRYIWALRTILIARCAEQRRACFSAAALANFSGDPKLKGIIDLRNTASPEEMISAGQRVVAGFGSPDVEAAWSSDTASQRAYMKKLGGIAESTLNLVSIRKRTVTAIEDVNVYE